MSIALGHGKRNPGNIAITSRKHLRTLRTRWPSQKWDSVPDDKTVTLRKMMSHAMGFWPFQDLDFEYLSIKENSWSTPSGNRTWLGNPLATVGQGGSWLGKSCIHGCFLPCWTAGVQSQVPKSDIFSVLIHVGKHLTKPPIFRGETPYHLFSHGDDSGSKPWIEAVAGSRSKAVTGISRGKACDLQESDDRF